MQQIIPQSFRFLLLAALQIFIFSSIQLLGYGTPFLFLFFILFLPLTTKRWLVLVLSFALGLCIDFFVGTYGLYAIASTFIAFIRIPLLRMVVHNFTLDEDEVTRLGDISIFDFLTYVLVASFLFSCVFFLVDFFSVFAFLRIGLHILASTITTVICIFICRYLFVNLNY